MASIATNAIRYLFISAEARSVGELLQCLFASSSNSSIWIPCRFFIDVIRPLFSPLHTLKRRTTHPCLVWLSGGRVSLSAPRVRKSARLAVATFQRPRCCCSPRGRLVSTHCCTGGRGTADRRVCRCAGAPRCLESARTTHNPRRNMLDQSLSCGATTRQTQDQLHEAVGWRAVTRGWGACATAITRSPRHPAPHARWVSCTFSAVDHGVASL